jgi:hypothetical protein
MSWVNRARTFFLSLMLFQVQKQSSHLQGVPFSGGVLATFLMVFLDKPVVLSLSNVFITSCAFLYSRLVLGAVV